jgi:hypothetical protein
MTALITAITLEAAYMRDRARAVMSAPRLRWLASLPERERREGWLLGYVIAGRGGVG